MKKLITLFLLLLSFIGYSQGLIILDGNKNVITEAVVNVSILPSSSVTFDVLLANSGTVANSYKVQRSYLARDTHDSSQFCWGGVCYPFLTGTSTHSDTISRGDTVDYGHNGFHSIFYSGTAMVTRKVHYQFYNIANAADSAGFTVQYTPTLAGVNEINISEILFEAYPNPASTAVSIKYNTSNSTQKAEIVFYDMLGKEVKEVVLNTQQGTTKINTDDLFAGIYFYSLVIGDKIYSTKKLVITK